MEGATSRRLVLLHFHLFKNAGTSLDRVLQGQFPGRWQGREFAPRPAGHGGEIADWIRAHPQAIAFSSHTITGPLPQLAQVDLLPLVLLRDPLARIVSAYRFERRQEAQTWGGELAKSHDLAGYVRARLAQAGDRQCRNFQTHRLASLCPGPAPELTRARQALDLIARQGVLGLVSDFDDMLGRLTRRLAPVFPGFSARPLHLNRSAPRPDPPEQAALMAELAEANRDDQALLAAAQDLLARSPINA